VGIQATGQIAFATGNISHCLHGLLQRSHDAAGDEGDQRGHDQRNAKTGPTCLPGLCTKLGLHIVDIHPRTNDPAPGLEQLHIGGFLHRLLGAGFWPAVVDHARAPGFRQAGHLVEDRKAVRVLDGRQVLAVELGIGRVHDHIRAQVIDPEIVIVVIAQGADHGQRLLLRGFPAQAAGGFQAVVVAQYATDGLHHMLGLLGFAFIQIVMYLL